MEYMTKRQSPPPPCNSLNFPCWIIFNVAKPPQPETNSGSLDMSGYTKHPLQHSTNNGSLTCFFPWKLLSCKKSKTFNSFLPAMLLVKVFCYLIQQEHITENCVHYIDQNALAFLRNSSIFHSKLFLIWKCPKTP